MGAGISGSVFNIMNYNLFSRIAIFLFIILTILQAQQSQLYIPLEMQRAYQKQTRSLDGKPGSRYWQNSSDYKIKAVVNPLTRILTGSETIRYINNSPDSLRQLVVRLYQNINKPGSQRDFPLDSLALNQGVKITRLMVGTDTLDPGDPVRLTYDGTNLIIELKKKVYSGESVNLQIDWQFTIPNTDQVRMGAYSETDFMIAYWYPQMAVYDDLFGWDKVDYTGQAEFYNDYSDYDVEIFVPGGYSVWSTGVLQNKEELFTAEYLKRYNMAYTSEEVVHIIGPDDLNKNIYYGKSQLRWNYKASSVPDFAFAMSNRFLWDGLSASSGSEDKSKVFVSAAYDPASKDFYEVAILAKKIIESLSEDFPGVPFPYPSLSVFNGGGGMEYPMMVNDASSGERWGTVHLTAHEITHTYFPFYVGINETRFAWMDEGFAVMIPAEIQNKLAPEYNPRRRNAVNYLQYAGTSEDVPPIVTSFVLNGEFYRTPAYYRSGAAYFILRDILGKEVFHKSLKEYIQSWNGKHPMPYDFFFTFNRSAGEDLNWFWKPWFFDYGYPDLTISDAKMEGTKLKILVRKLGNLPIPVSGKVYQVNGKTIPFYKTARIWSSGFDEAWIEIKVEDNVEYINLEDFEIPDINYTNNFFKFRK